MSLPSTLRSLLIAGACALGLLAPVPAPVAAQGLFSPVLYVNDAPITNYQIDQKRRFLEFIGAGGADPRARAIERLIEERLQEQELERLGGRLTPDQLDSAMAEFAGRAELTTEELLARMREAGIDTDTFVAFIRVGAMWRELIQQRYGSQVSVSDSRVDNALSVESIQPQTEVLISEIFLPAAQEFAADVQRLIPLVLAIGSEAEFANAARQVSIAPSAASGGRVDRWINVAAMPPEVAGVMAEGAIGTILGPIATPEAYAFFLLRARRETRGVTPDQVELVYARATLPGGMTDANRTLVARIDAATDSCVDFPGVVLRSFPSLPESAVEQVSERQNAVPRAILSELERLNPGQISATLVQDGSLLLLMLCNRQVTGEGVPSREEVRFAVLNETLERQSALVLQRLRAEAEIRYP